MIYTSALLSVVQRLIYAEEVEPSTPVHTVHMFVSSVHDVSVLAKLRARENIIFCC